ncbi:MULTISPECIES: phosphatidylserine decarboxylase [Kordiimonas]|uniref:Phosphatidylserine decarboxylase proenzyme n=1 Tax=Kordiimonas lacus TaxID=637679 RepID=A0A1G7CRG2_9PROT|nr:phosphatidylserine decarboxylase [Kordiimonas lacus]SDE41095.1 phosphatidylserine decarboxylase [Kordiimonas lacus]
MKAMDVVMTPIHKEGHMFVAIFFAVSVGLFFLSEPLGWAGLILTGWCLYFFRDPERVVPDEKGVLVSPADGTVCLVMEATPPAELGMGDEPRTRISIFLSVFNVHVNRAPAAGEITNVAYVPGKFLNAAAEEASEENERQLIRMTTEDGHDIAFAQVAGLVARRILCDLEVDQTVERGERFGLIRFGSRTDIYLDKGQKATVAVGQTMIGGETIIARKAPARRKAASADK